MAVVDVDAQLARARALLAEVVPDAGATPLEGEVSHGVGNFAWLIPSWMRDALCVEPAYASVDFFPASGQSAEPALAICRRCLVRAECLEFAMSSFHTRRAGIWGGTTPAEREAVRPARRRSRCAGCGGVLPTGRVGRCCACG